MSTANETTTGDDTIPVKNEQKQQAEDTLRCPNCGATSFEHDDSQGEMFCRDCGTIVEDKSIDTSKEWRAFDSGEKSKKSRSGSAFTYTKSDRGFKTRIGHSGELNKVSGDKRGKYYRMRKWDRRKESKERGLDKALTELQKMVSQLGLPDSVYEEAARLVEKAKKQDLIKGRGIEKTVAGVLFLVARNQEVPRTLEELAEAAGVKKRDLGKTYRYVARELEMDIQPAMPEHFIPRYGQKLGLSGKKQGQARRLIEKARDKGVLAGRSPKSIVAAVFYIVGKENPDITQKRIAEVVGVTEVTVRKNYSDILDEVDVDL